MSNNAELQNLVYIDQSDFGCNIVERCPHQERTLSYALGVEIPTVGQPPEEQFKECCYTHVTLADVNSNDDFKNDYSSFYHQKQLPNETVNFFLYRYENAIEYPLNNSNYGTFFDFGAFVSNPNLKGYLVKWKNVLATLGDGNYKIIKRNVVAGVSVETSSIVFTLRQFSTAVANHTVRIDIVMNGSLTSTGDDFTGTAWKHSMRIPGFFGRREPQFEEDNLVNRNYEKRQVSMHQTNEYKFQTNLLPDCITDEFWDFFLLANDIYFNDYNLNNHSYKYVKFGAKFASNSGTGYGDRTRKAILNLTFNDKFENNIKRNYK